jgi:hypothetical protein
MRIPTLRGDVLILETESGIKIHAVGPVTTDGQQDFHAQPSVKYIKNRDAALREARALVAPGRRIYLLNLDHGNWSEVSS